MRNTKQRKAKHSSYSKKSVAITREIPIIRTVAVEKSRFPEEDEYLYKRELFQVRNENVI
jgi:hypothetical protein